MTLWNDRKIIFFFPENEVHFDAVVMMARLPSLCNVLVHRFKTLKMIQMSSYYQQWQRLALSFDYPHHSYKKIFTLRICWAVNT